MHDVQHAFQKIQKRLKEAQIKAKNAVNKKIRHMDFEENDWVLLKLPKSICHQKFYAKLERRYYGHFQVFKRINKMAYRLKLLHH